MKVEQLIKNSIKVTQNNKALAAYLGCNERTIYRWLSGQFVPNSKFVMKMIELTKNL
jgi:DNA-binding transcriptional regulator YiaG